MRLLTAFLLAAAVAACGGGGGRGSEAGVPCDGVLRPADPAAALPAGIPAGVDRPSFVELQTQGATKRHLADLAGTDLVATRDKVQAAFQAAGFEILGADDEAGAEAEFQWRGKGQEGSVQVVPLCQGHLRLRYRVGPV